MSKEELIRELKYTKEKHKNDRVDTFETNIILMCEDILKVLNNCIEIPENHGKIVDLGNIDKDMVEQDNPVMSINIYGTAIEAVPLDYLYNLPDLTKKEKRD